MKTEIELAFKLADKQIKKALDKCKSEVERNVESVKPDIIKEFARELSSVLYCIPQQDFTLLEVLHNIDNLVERRINNGK